MSSLASIDVGSNTLRLLICRIEKNKLTDIFVDRKITRLGNGVEQTGKLQDENIEASIKALQEFSSAISRYGARHVRAIATSALREAANSDAFIKRVFDATGIKIEVITGEKEAELTLKGVLFSFPVHECRLVSPRLSPPVRGETAGSFSRSMFIVDIGGGSTEWILCRGDDVDMGSIPTGVIKLTRNFLKSDPVSEDDLAGLNSDISSVIEDLRKKIGRFISDRTLFIGTGGTFTSVASIDLGLNDYSRERIHLHKVSLSALQKISMRLLALPLEERKKVQGLEPERADLIMPGIQFTIKIMESFRFDELLISDYGLLEGALLDIGKGISETGKS